MWFAPPPGNSAPTHAPPPPNCAGRVGHLCPINSLLDSTMAASSVTPGNETWVENSVRRITFARANRRRGEAEPTAHGARPHHHQRLCRYFCPLDCRSRATTGGRVIFSH